MDAPSAAVVLPEAAAASYGALVEAAGPSIRLVPVASAVRDDIASADVLLHAFWWGSPRVEDVLAAMSALRWVHSTGAGLDDLVAARLQERDVWVTNAAGAYAPAMAEYALAGMVLLSRGWRRWLDAERGARWLERTAPSGSSLYGKQVGILGYGSVGRHLATIVKALGMTVWATRRTPGFVSAEPLDRLLAADDLAELLGASDFVVVAASFNTSTRHLLDAGAFAAMKPGAFLVNVARGGLVDHDALVDALESGRLGGAVLDVTDPEPLPADSPLWSDPRVFVTPHVAGDTGDGWRRGIELFCANLRRYLAGAPTTMGNLVDLREHA